MLDCRKCCREEKVKEDAEIVVLDIVGKHVCGFPVAEEGILYPLGYLCILPEPFRLPQECDRCEYGPQFPAVEIW